MKELLKKASLTVASACLIAGGLVSFGFAAGPDVGQGVGSEPNSANGAPADKTADQMQTMPAELEVNGQMYKRVRRVSEVIDADQIFRWKY